MKKTRKKIRNSLLVFFGIVVSGGLIYFNSLLPIITGYAAKNLCSAVFISGRDPEHVENTDLNFSFIKYAKNSIDRDENSVTSRYLWRKSKAIYREGFGTTLVRDIPEKEIRKVTFPSGISAKYLQDTIVWPLGNIIPDTVTGINISALGDISNRLTKENSYGGNPFAFIVLHKGMPVMEAYKSHFDKDTRFLSWSMAKSFMNALIGILVRQGKIDIYQPTGLEEWQDDERSRITLNDLMQMQSGLEWNEDYGNRSDVTVMLHCEGDMAEFASEQQSGYPVGSHWYYSSGTTNIVSHIIREKLGNDSLYYSLAKSELFNKIGMPDALFEVDASGTMVGSSYLYATARDYARFGLLYMNDGVFNGERILPEGWVKYSTSVAPESDGRYGSFFWLNKGGVKKLPSVPEDMFRCDGHDGQHIFIIPSLDLIVVVLGYSPTSNRVNLDRLLGDIIKAL